MDGEGRPLPRSAESGSSRRDPFASPARGIVVFAVVYQSAQTTETTDRLAPRHARRYPCCDGTYVAGGEYALTGAGPAAAYSVIVRVYFGSPPTRSMRAQAQRALDHLELPSTSVSHGPTV